MLLTTDDAKLGPAHFASSSGPELSQAIGSDPIHLLDIYAQPPSPSPNKANLVCHSAFRSFSYPELSELVSRLPSP